ncbi:uncharacterized protein BJ212DRAFT_1296507 [Suillus subaureus]|uniref:Uncharacterized protein n=1 Tax=Suillus subaureus TaxID=48587 RepID=A0A9P7EHR9_9AGAM|nr:uncharacterized protein BJ212DRAFT_1296507 [Suillus subaureus]KAG1822443.1 hypothetical protein BJ212DRAFT_1296507 [Suillus subaureus]
MYHYLTVTYVECETALWQTCDMGKPHFFACGHLVSVDFGPIFAHHISESHKYQKEYGYTNSVGTGCVDGHLAILVILPTSLVVIKAFMWFIYNRQNKPRLPPGPVPLPHQ